MGKKKNYSDSEDNDNERRRHRKKHRKKERRRSRSRSSSYSSRRSDSYEKRRRRKEQKERRKSRDRREQETYNNLSILKDLKSSSGNAKKENENVGENFNEWDNEQVDSRNKWSDDPDAFVEEIKTIKLGRDRKKEEESVCVKETDKEKEAEKEKPNFAPSGLLAKETQMRNGVFVKFTEPLDAAVPHEFWRIYPFRDNETLDPLHLYKQSSYLIGKDERVASIHINHPSCSRQHAVIQFRKVASVDEEGKPIQIIKPYLMDLESTNGTFINKTKIEPARYYELKNYDLLNFGFSTRDFIITKVEKDEDNINPFNK